MLEHASSKPITAKVTEDLSYVIQVYDSASKGYLMRHRALSELLFLTKEKASDVIDKKDQFL